MKPNYNILLYTEFANITIPAHIELHSGAEGVHDAVEELQKLFAFEDYRNYVYAEELEETQEEKTND